MKRLLYWLYARRLSRQIRAGEAPQHVGIILDGNRRYARKHRLADPCEAYNIGAEKLDDVLAWCAELQIRAVTLWVCSIDNLRRSPDEVSGILAAVETKIGELAADPALGRLGVRVKAVGRLDLLPASTVAVLREAERRPPLIPGSSSRLRSPTEGARKSRTPSAISFARGSGEAPRLKL
jgi:short-chain Z-isoprenyl diphosphate synthase